MTGRDSPVVSLRDAAMTLGGRTLWSEVDLEVRPGELIAILGPNGAGKSTLLRAVLGEMPLSAGRVEVLGAAPGRRAGSVGYVPQQKLFDRAVPMRGQDLVAMGLDGHRFGLPLPRARRSKLIGDAVELVGAGHYASRRVGMLSGGEQQRLRIAQALVSQPALLLCDEPLLSLDLAHQAAVLDAIDDYRRRSDAAVLLVTHDVNPLLSMVDRILYFAPGGHRIGAVSEVLTGAVLTELYGVHVDVIDVHGRILVVADDGANAPGSPVRSVTE